MLVDIFRKGLLDSIVKFDCLRNSLVEGCVDMSFGRYVNWNIELSDLDLKGLKLFLNVFGSVLIVYYFIFTWTINGRCGGDCV
jgi:hypothetical protein